MADDDFLECRPEMKLMHGNELSRVVDVQPQLESTVLAEKARQLSQTSAVGTPIFQC
jgi:hypothetical protein